MQSILLHWGYVALLVATMISSMGIPVGAEIALGFAGAISSGHVVTATNHDHMTLALVIVVATLGEVAGCLIGYTIGYVGGRPLVDRLSRYALLTKKDVDRAETWFNRRGEPLVLSGRFVPLLRSFLSLAAGISRMRAGKFTLFTAIGCAGWCAALAAIGYSLGSSWHRVIKDFSYAGYILAVLAVLTVGAFLFVRLAAARRERALEPSRP